MEGSVVITVYIGLAGRSPPGGRSGGGAVRLLVVVEEASQAGGRVAAGSLWAVGDSILHCASVKHLTSHKTQRRDDSRVF